MQDDLDWFHNKSLGLVEKFTSLQGEGARAGTPCVFVRFSGCSHQCAQCDTPWQQVNERITPQQIVEYVADTHLPNVIFTGGEPSLQLRRPLVEALQAAGVHCAIETNGYYDVSHLKLDWITVSPKNVSGGPIKLPDWKQRTGNELKVLFPDAFNNEILFNANGFDHYYVSPVFEGKGLDNPLTASNMDRAINFCMMHPRWKLSVQQHKVWGVR